MNTKRQSIVDAIAAGDPDLTPDELRLEQINDRLNNPTAPQLHFAKRKTRQGIEMHFQINHIGGHFGRIIAFKSRHDLQAAAALLEAVVQGLFAPEYKADQLYAEEVHDEVVELTKKIKAADAEKEK